MHIQAIDVILYILSNGVVSVINGLLCHK